MKQFPGRVLSIYIRDVALPERKKIAVEVSQSLTEHKIEMIIVEAAEHAAKAGLIFTQAIPAIVQDKKEDKGQEPGKEAAAVL